MKTSYINLPNEILNIDLTANELAVLFYLATIYSQGRDTVCVKQSTIADRCGIRTTQTVAKITASLADKGLIACRRCIYDNNSTGMIYYTLKMPDISTGYFSVQRQIVKEQLTPVQLRTYLFICRTISPTLGQSWNSYNDLAKILGTSRGKAITIVAQLIKKNVIRRHKVKSHDNKRVFCDNHYTVVRYVSHNRIRKAGFKKANKKGLLSSTSSPTGQSENLSYTSGTLSGFAYLFFLFLSEKKKRKKACYQPYFTTKNQKNLSAEYTKNKNIFLHKNSSEKSPVFLLSVRR